MKLRLLPSVALLLLSAGCDETGAFSDEMPDDLPAGRCEESTGEACETDGSTGGSSTGAASTSSSSTGTGVDCLSEGCTGQGVCAADWDIETEERGAFACRFQCVPLLDDTAWCSDDTSCCDSSAQCTPRGYCVLPEPDGDGTTSTGGV